MAGAFTLIAGLSALAALILIAMTFVFAQIIGWRALARSYGGPPGSGTRFASKDALIGANSWNAPPLLVAIDDSGITLIPRPPFRFAFATLHIPWQLAQSFEARSYTFFEALELRFGSDAASLISFIPSRATEAIAAYFALHRETAHATSESAGYSPATE